MWEDSSYCWAVVCKNRVFHFPRNMFYKHKILLAETDATIPRPPVDVPFTVRCDMCGKEYRYQPSDVLRIEKEIPEGFVTHPMFREN